MKVGKRIIPCLQLIDESLVKTIQFKKINYIGDPANTVRIFNELEVDELCFLDIRATIENREVNFKLLENIANESFMPLSYGGGIKDFKTVKRIFKIGFEKVVINSNFHINKELIKNIVEEYGSQALVISIDYKDTIFGNKRVFTKSGIKKINYTPLEVAKMAEDNGAGELFLTNIKREGTWDGFDLETINEIVDNVSIPVVAHGGGNSVDNVKELFQKTNIEACALGSMLVYQKKDFGVLINFPDELKKL